MATPIKLSPCCGAPYPGHYGNCMGVEPQTLSETAHNVRARLVREALRQCASSDRCEVRVAAATLANHATVDTLSYLYRLLK